MNTNYIVSFIHNTFNKSSLAILIILLSYLSYSSYRHPLYNWDMLCYSSIVLKIDGINDDFERQKKLYSCLAHSVSKKTFEDLTGENPYRIQQYNDAISFANQERWHYSKPLYISLIFIFYKLGVNLFASSVLVSIISCLALLLLSYKVLRGNFPMWLSSLITATIAINPNTRELFKLSSPDSLSALFFILILYLINRWNKEKSKINLTFLTISSMFLILTRSENFIFIFFLSISFYWFNRAKTSIISLIFYITSTFSLAFSPSLFSKIGWKQIYYHSFIERLNYPLNADLSALSFEYFGDTLKYFSMIYINQGVSLIFFTSIIFFYFLLKRVKFHYTIALPGIAFTALITRFILYPFPDTRYYYGYYLFILISMLIQIRMNPENK